MPKWAKKTALDIYSEYRRRYPPEIRKRRPCDAHPDQVVLEPHFEINKYRRYRNEPEHFFCPYSGVWWLTGDHHTDTLIYMDDHWSCDCEYDLDNELPCGHVMALEALLDTGMLSEEEQTFPEPMHFTLPATFPVPAETIPAGTRRELWIWGKTHPDTVATPDCGRL